MGRWKKGFGLGILSVNLLLAFWAPRVSGQTWVADRCSHELLYPAVVTPSGGTALAISGTRLLVVDQGRVRIFNLNGTQLGTTIPTTGMVAIVVINSRIVVADDGRIRLFDLNGNQLGTSIQMRHDSRSPCREE